MLPEVLVFTDNSFEWRRGARGLRKAIAVEKLVPNLVFLHKHYEGCAVPGSRYYKMSGTENLGEFMMLEGYSQSLSYGK